MISDTDRLQSEFVVQAGLDVAAQCMKAEIPDELIRDLLMAGFVQEGDTVGPESYVKMAYVAATALHRLAVLTAAFEALGGLPPKPDLSGRDGATNG